MKDEIYVKFDKYGIAEINKKEDSNVEELFNKLQKKYHSIDGGSFMLTKIKQALSDKQSTINAIKEVVNSMPNLVECVFSDETMENYKKLVPNGYESVRIVNQNAKLYFKYFKKFKQIVEAQNEK